MITMEELLASQPQKLTTLFRGQEVEGSVVAITDKEITLDLDAKAEGIIQARDIPPSQLKDLKIGSKIKSFVNIPENENGQVILSSSPQTKVTSYQRKGHGINWSRFIQAQNQKTKLQGKVLEVNKGGLIVEAESIRGFLPNSQVGFELLTKAEQGMEGLIGVDLTVTVIEVDSDNNKLIFSQRGQVSEETLKKLKEFKEDQKVKGKIVAILPFGLVVSVKDRSASGGDVLGVEGLVFIADVSWEKVDELQSKFKAGEEIEVLIISLDEELGRLNLSIKQLTDDPFAKLAEKYPADEVVKGEITAITDTGVAVKLDGIEGFLPTSKMDQDTKYEIGKSMSFLVDSVDSNRRKINLAPFVTSTAGLIYK